MLLLEAVRALRTVKPDEVVFIGVDDLLVNKRAVGREVDLRDVRVIERVRALRDRKKS